MLDEAGNTLGQTLQRKLAALGIHGEVVGFREGPRFVSLFFRPAAATRVRSVEQVAGDLSLLFGGRVRVLAPVEGRSYLAIEVPNQQRVTVLFESLMWEMHGKQYRSPLTFPVGVDTFGNLVTADLRELPHLLVAGSSGSGKSNFLHTLILSLMHRTPYAMLHFLLIDPKAVEFAQYAREGHVMGGRALNDAEAAIESLRGVLGEVERRYTRMAAKRVRHASQLGLPDIVVVVDELADLMAVARKELPILIQRIAQKARAAGIHLVLATQRPSVETVPGIIKANFPARLAFRLPSMHDSRTILDTGGAEHLLGSGDGLFVAPGIPLTRIQSAFVSDEVAESIIAPMRYPTSRWARWMAAWQRRSRSR